MANRKARRTILEILAQNVEIPEGKHPQIITGAPVFSRGVVLPLSFTQKDFFKREAFHKASAIVSVAELKKDASAQKIFDYLYKQGKYILLTQEQIVTFCQHHEAYLRKEGYGTLFFFKEGKTICYVYVTYMNPNDKGQMLTALLHNELGAGKYHGKFRHRVVYQ